MYYFFQKYYKLKYVLLLLLLTVIILLSFILFPVRFSNDAGFKKVDSLSVKADLLGVFIYQKFLSLASLQLSDRNDKFNLKYKYKTKYKTSSNKKYLLIRNFPKVAITPDESKVFIGLKKEILEFDTFSYQLNSIIKTDWDDDKTDNLNPFLVILANNLFFSNFDGGSSIYKCNIRDSDHKIQKTKYFATEMQRNLAMIKTSDNLYTDLTFFDSEPILVPLFQLKGTPRTYYSFDIIDYTDSKGWLFSTDFQLLTKHASDFYILKKKAETPKKLKKGKYAKWGADGYVYYLNRTGDLFRVYPKDNIEELVFKVPRGAFDVHDVCTTPVMSSDRKLLAHKFGNKIAVFDLLKKEYRIIKNIPILLTDLVFSKRVESDKKKN